MPSSPPSPASVSSGWIRYLSVVTATMAAFGLAMVLLPAPIETLVGRLFFGDGGFPDSYTDDALSYARFTHGVLGAVMVGWMLLIGWVVRSPVAQGVPGAWRALVLAIASWFVLDSTISLLTGFWQNAVGNAVFGTAFLVGLVAIRPRRSALGA